MAEISIPDAIAQVNLAALYDTAGHAVYLPAPTVAWFRAQGRNAVTLTIVLKQAEARDDGLTLSEAAEMHISDVDGLDRKRAYRAIHAACSAGRIAYTGERSRKRLDPVSFAAWRLQRREENLARSDD